jgi:cyclohexanecarboxylate-CoA ligase
MMRAAAPAASHDAPLLWTYLRRAASEEGDRTALVHGGIRLSYAELASEAEALAAALAAAGVRVGDVVSYQLPNGREAILTALAALRIGAVANPIVPIYRRKEVSFIVAQAKPAVIFAPAAYRGFNHADMMVEIAGAATSVISCGGDVPGAIAFDRFLEGYRGRGCALPDASPDADALLLYTSGTEGDPKGVRHSQRNLIVEAKSVIAATDVTADDPIFMASPLTHITGFMYGSILSVVLRTKLCLMDGWAADAAADMISVEGCTWTAGATPFLQGLLDDRLADRIATLKKFRCGGADVPPKLIRDARARGIRAMRTYGCSEHPTISGGVFDDPGKAATTDGRVHAANAVRIVDLDDETKVLAAGAMGEIQSRGPEVFLGYRDPGLDSKAFTPDGWLRTGDIGRLDEQGYITVIGRKKDIIIRKGENISAKEIEDLLIEMPEIALVAVVGIPDAERGEMTVAVCVPAPHASPTLAAITRHLERAGLARQKFPERLELVAELPMNAAGKIRKVDIRKRLAAMLEKADA